MLKKLFSRRDTEKVKQKEVLNFTGISDQFLLDRLCDSAPRWPIHLFHEPANAGSADILSGFLT